MCVRGKRSLSRLLRNSNRLAALQLPWDRRRAWGHTLPSGRAVSFRQATCVQARGLWAGVTQTWLSREWRVIAGAELGRPLPTPHPRKPGESLPCLHPRSSDPSPPASTPKGRGLPLSRHSVSLITFKLIGTDLWCSFEIFAGEKGVDS